MTPVSAYYERMGNCKFCLVPKGVGYTNGRLFESFFSGCIPIVLSDALRFPFSYNDGGPVKWQNHLVIHYPTRYMDHLPEFLERVDDNHINYFSGLESVISNAKWPKVIGRIFKNLMNTSKQESPNDLVGVYMQSQLRDKSCWFDYYSTNPNCSPYEGILRGLKRSRSRVEQWEY